MKADQDPRFISRRNFLKAAATAIGGLTLAACGASGGGGAAGGGEAGGGAAGGGAAAGKTNIVAWYWDDSLQLAVDQFHQKNQNIQVKFEKLGYDDTHKKTLTSFAAGGGGADVVAIEIGYVGQFARRGGLADLLAAPYNGGEFKADMVEYKWVQGSTPDGRLVCMPWDIGPAGIWYRADLFEKAGLPTTPEEVGARVKTWDDLFQLAADLKKKTPNTALMADAFGPDIYGAMVEQQGHGWFQENKLLFEEKATKPLQRALDFRKQGLDANIDWWGAEWSTGVKKDAFAGMGIACWMQTGLTRDQPQTIGKWRAIRAPEGDFNMGGSFLSMPESGKNKNAAWEFLKYVCCTAEGQNTIFKQRGIFPAYKPAWKDPVYDAPQDFFGGQKAFRLWLDISEGVPGNVVNPNDRQAGDILGAEITKVEKEGKDPVQAVKDAEAEALKRIQGITG